MTDIPKKKLPAFQILTRLPPPSWDAPSEWKVADQGVEGKIHDRLVLAGVRNGLEGLLPGSEVLLYHEKVREPLIRNDLTLIFKAGQDYFFAIHQLHSGNYHIPSRLTIWYLPDKSMGRVLRRFQRMDIPGEDHFPLGTRLFRIAHVAGEDVPESYFED